MKNQMLPEPLARVHYVIFTDRVVIVLAKQNLAKPDSAPLVKKEVEASSRAALPPCLEYELTRAVWGLVAWLELYRGRVPLRDPAEAR